MCPWHENNKGKSPGPRNEEGVQSSELALAANFNPMTVLGWFPIIDFSPRYWLCFPGSLHAW